VPCQVQPFIPTRALLCLCMVLLFVACVRVWCCFMWRVCVYSSFFSLEKTKKNNLLFFFACTGGTNTLLGMPGSSP